MSSRVALTIGDPAGIGSEVALKFLENNSNTDTEFTLFGHKGIIDRCYRDVLKIERKSEFEIIEPNGMESFDFEYGKHSKACGDASMRYIKNAVDYVSQKKADALVTLPINKYSIHSAGYDFVGHTEYLAHLTGSEKISMMLASNKLKVILTTTHLPLRNLCNLLTEEKILTAIENAHNAGKLFGIESVKIGVCALNPHAGDNGALGDDEINLINPTIDIAKKKGVNIDYCKPADTIFLDKSYDIIVAMYHDQALIPIKLLSFGNGVNVTLGLPIIRTSVDHGTAFDIAGKGIASTSSLTSAVNMAISMVNYVNAH